jgi:NADH-quinone oxidoreductase subunit J
MNGIVFGIIAIFMLSAALAAATLPRFVHAALMFALSSIGLAAAFFLLGAEFVGLVQIFVYVGAVAILIVFTILLTRRDVEIGERLQLGGAGIALAVFATLAWAILRTPGMKVKAPTIEPLTIRQIGDTLMTSYAWPLLSLGVLLTAALVGALVLLTEERR